MLHRILDYDQKTGVFTWKVNRYSGNHGQFITCTAGDAAGCIDKSTGYRKIGIDGSLYLAHRLAWFYVYGYWPEHGVDHRDRHPDHNWISNLRESSKQCNARNTGNPSTNSSGVKGVYWSRRYREWCAQVCVLGKTRYLGRYGDFDDAVCARLAAEQCLGWKGCDSDSPAFRHLRSILREVK